MAPRKRSAPAAGAAKKAEKAAAPAAKKPAAKRARAPAAAAAPARAVRRRAAPPAARPTEELELIDHPSHGKVCPIAADRRRGRRRLPPARGLAQITTGDLTPSSSSPPLPTPPLHRSRPTSSSGATATAGSSGRART
jgi:hypothetical protein